jgi:signal transduction histidine kinase
MSRIKFIFETRQKRILLSLLAVFVLVFSALGVSLKGEIGAISFKIAIGLSLFTLALVLSIFLNKHFVYGNNSYLFLRIHTFFFKTIQLNQIESVAMKDQQLYIKLAHKNLNIDVKDIAKDDVSRLETILIKFQNSSV